MCVKNDPSWGAGGATATGPERAASYDAPVGPITLVTAALQLNRE